MSDLAPRPGGTAAERPDSFPSPPSASRGRSGAVEVEWDFFEGYLWMEKAWEAMPARIRKAASDVVNPTECAQGRWFADNDRNGVWDVLLIGPQRSVFVSGQQDTKPVRYTFAYVTDTLETKELKQLAPTQPNPPQKGSRVGGSHSEEPWEWFRDLSNLPYRVQDVVRFSLPASVKGLRWSGGFCTNDRAEETLAVFAATRKLMVYTWGHRQVAADPFGQTMTTDQRRRAAPWDVVIVRAQLQQSSVPSPELDWTRRPSIPQ